MDRDFRVRLVFGIAAGLLAVGVDLLMNRIRRLSVDIELANLQSAAAHQRCAELEMLLERRPRRGGDGVGAERN